MTALPSLIILNPVSSSTTTFCVLSGVAGEAGRERLEKTESDIEAGSTEESPGRFKGAPWVCNSRFAFLRARLLTGGKVGGINWGKAGD